MASSVAIIIPTRNRATLACQAVQSVLDSATTPAEVVVVDAGSSDDTREQLRRFGDRIRVIEGEPGNAATTRNAGVRASTAPFLGFLDSDDLMLPGKITCLEPVLSGQPDAGLVYGGIQAINESDTVDAEAIARRATPRKGGKPEGATYLSLAEWRDVISTSATLVRRAAFDSIEGYDEELNTCQDWDLYLRLSLRWRLVSKPCFAAKYRVWEGNVSWQRTAIGVAKVAEKHLSELSRVPSEERESAQLVFLGWLAGAHHTLVHRREARTAAMRAIRLHPVRALARPRIRHAFLASFLPGRVLWRRRPVAPREGL